jgi:hypothetical protein
VSPIIAPLGERDLPEAERIFRLAFGTFLGVPEPETFGAIGTLSMVARGHLMSPHSAPRSMASWLVPTLRQNGEASASSGRSPSAPISRNTGLARLCSPRQWTNSMPGGPGTPGFSPSLTVPSTSRCIRSSGSTRAFSPRSCRRRRSGRLRRGRLVALQRIGRRSEGRCSSRQQRRDEYTLPGARPV